MTAVQSLPAHDLSTLAGEVECIRLTNVAWIAQAEHHNRNSPSLPGARERTPVLVGTLFWLEKLAALSAAAGGDDGRVAAMLDRALAKTAGETPANG